MPAKAPGTRAPRAPRAPARRARPAAPPASPPPPSSPPPAQEYNALQAAIARVFAAAQKTTAGHRKLVINLRSTYEQCVTGTGPVGSTVPPGKYQGEKVFVEEFCRFLNRIMVVKKSEAVGDRCLRFTDLFVKGLFEKDKPKDKPRRKVPVEGEEPEEEPEEQEPEPEPFRPKPPHRFALALLEHLRPLLNSSEKVVRYRSSQLVALLLSNSLIEFPFDYSSVSYEIFLNVGRELGKRMRDKEAVVRVQAGIGIVRLMEMGVGSDEDDEEDDGLVKGTSLLMLIDSMQNDPSADVRRTILHNVSPTPASLPYLLERARDTDAYTRRSVFAHLLPTLGDFRHLSISMREKLLRWGLNDRDEAVRVAARKIFNYRWIEDTGGDLLDVLERLDVMGDGVEGGVKELALQGFWAERKDVVEQITFGDDYFERLSAESAFLARSFNDYCRSSPDEKMVAVLEEKMPEATKLAWHLQRYMNKLVAALETGDDEAPELEFVVTQMLMIAARTDYGDEIGRRKMFALLREGLGIPELPDGVTRLVVECLAKLSMGEGDFCMVVLEVIAEIHDTIVEEEGNEEEGGENESFHSAQSDLDDIEDTITVKPPQRKDKAKEVAKSKKSKPIPEEDEDMMDVDAVEVVEEAEDEDEDEEAKAIRHLMINLKCLHIAQFMLENVHGSLKQNTHLVTMLNGLIVPAVRSHEAPVREQALRCLGLSCLLDRTLAEQNLTLFAHCLNKGHNVLQIEALHIMSDILATHGAVIFEGESCAVDQRVLYRMFAKGVKNHDAIDVQATAAEVACKLMLAQVIKDEELLKALVVSYFNPSTIDNHSLRQILTYFFPVYCHSKPENQVRMASIVVSTIHALMVVHDGLGEEEEMVGFAAIASQIVDWTDPRKNVGGGVQAGKGGFAEKVVDPDVQVTLAAALLERLDSTCSKEEKKVVITFLGKLYLPADADAEKLRNVYELVAQAIDSKIASDAPSRNALNKLEVSLGKIVGDLAAAEREETMIAAYATGDETDAPAAEEAEDVPMKGPKGAEEGEGDGETEEEDDEGDVTIRPAGAGAGAGEGEGQEEEEEEGEEEDDEL